ncbi:MAG: hypothetical protein ACOY30_03475 [Bacillota bacterium]
MKFYYSKIIEGEHDLPLPGPWNRRQGGARQPEGDVPHEDKPLPGPWSRRREEYDTPRSDVPETAAGPEYGGRDQTEDTPPPEPVRPRRRPVAAHRRAEPEAGPAGRTLEAAFACPPDVAGDQPAAAKKETEPCVTPRQDQQYRNVLLRNMLSPSGLYAGIVMAEVLGSRGGRNGRQSSVVGRQYRRH